MSGSAVRRSKTWAEIAVGEEASLRRLCLADDLVVFAHASGNLNPIHLPDGDAATHERAPSMWIGSLISSVLGNVLPGPGTTYRSQTLAFHAPAVEGDQLVIGVRVTEKRAEPELVLATWVDRADGTRLCDGEAIVLAPEVPVIVPHEAVPGLIVQRHEHFDRFIALAERLPPLRTAVVAPEEAVSLGGALLAAQHHLIAPTLIGDLRTIEAVAREAGLDLAGTPIVDAPQHDDAAARAVALVHEGTVDAVMKGHLHTDELLRHVVKRDGGLRTSRRLSHVFVMDVPGLGRPLLITDAAINIAPDLEAKVDIVQNAIDLARALGIESPRVAILSAVETVNPKIPSTLDAAVLSKMAERGQITGGAVDGPLAMDNAVNLGAARTKGLKGLVAGEADILVAPNLEAGNMIVKQLTFMAHADSGGLVLGASAPVILTSRADDERVRLGSCAIAALAFAARKDARRSRLAAE